MDKDPSCIDQKLPREQLGAAGIVDQGPAADLEQGAGLQGLQSEHARCQKRNFKENSTLIYTRMKQLAAGRALWGFQWDEAWPYDMGLNIILFYVLALYIKDDTKSHHCVNEMLQDDRFRISAAVLLVSLVMIVREFWQSRQFQCLSEQRDSMIKERDGIEYLQEQLTEHTTRIGEVGFILACVLSIFVYLTRRSSTRDHANMLDVFLHILSIFCTMVVVAVPEGLPRAAALMRACSVRALLRKGNTQLVVQSLRPCEAILETETGEQSMGEVVAMTGDGTSNADLGFVTEAEKWSRSFQFSIEKLLHFQLTALVTACTMTFVEAVSSGDVPLTIVQLLWLKLIMETLGPLALATVQPPTEELMQKPPVDHRKEPLITRKMWTNLAGQVIHQVAVLLALQFRGVELLQRLPGESKDAGTINRTVIFNTFMLCQIFNLMNSRQPRRLNIFHGLQNDRLFVGVVGAIVILQVVMVEFLGKFASTSRSIGVSTPTDSRSIGLDWQQWLVCLVLASLSWPVALIFKLMPVRERERDSRNVI